MNWQNKIKLLMEHGKTQAEIAAYCECSQGLISDIANGRRGKRLSYEIGVKIDAFIAANDICVEREAA